MQAIAREMEPIKNTQGVNLNDKGNLAADLFPQEFLEGHNSICIRGCRRGGDNRLRQFS
jgi:hypothetical protein